VRRHARLVVDTRGVLREAARALARPGGTVSTEDRAAGAEIVQA
jgi:hypothetical protein